MKVISILLSLLFLSPLAADERADDILQFWFRGLNKKQWDVPQEQYTLWFGKEETIDAMIKNRYASLLIELENGKLDSWKKTPQGLLALIILTDQFPRNMFRGTPKMYAYDSYAVSFAEQLLSSGKVEKLHPVEKVFVYLPFEHAENLNLQKLCVICYENLITSIPEKYQDQYVGFLSYAEQHRAIVEKFGRFPHRNHILKRASTPEEEKYLQQPNSGF